MDTTSAKRNGDAVKTRAGTKNSEQLPPCEGEMNPTVRGPHPDSGLSHNWEDELKSGGTASVGSGTATSIGSWPVSRKGMGRNTNGG